MRRMSPPYGFCHKTDDDLSWPDNIDFITWDSNYIFCTNLNMETRVGCWVIVTAMVMNQNANRVITEVIGSAMAALNDTDAGSVTSLFAMKNVDIKDKTTENTPDMVTRWLVVMLSLLLITLTLITLATLTAAAA